MLLPRFTTFALAAAPLSLLMSACSYMPQISPSLSARLDPRPAVTPQEAMAPIKPREHMLFAITEGNLLVSFNASTPGLLFSKTPLTGLAKGETLIGIDFRVAKGELFGLSDQGRLLRIHLGSGAVTAVGKPVPLPKGDAFGVDFNPTVDRVRVVSNTGANLRLHP